ncbi:MAG: hypothetical protein IPN81_11270 [Nitrosomonadales bacterium]|nr:hypothetical protein [Nitrosomonadales bacterium]
MIWLLSFEYTKAQMHQLAHCGTGLRTSWTCLGQAGVHKQLCGTSFPGDCTRVVNLGQWFDGVPTTLAVHVLPEGESTLVSLFRFIRNQFTDVVEVRILGRWGDDFLG